MLLKDKGSFFCMRTARENFETVEEKGPACVCKVCGSIHCQKYDIVI